MRPSYIFLTHVYCCHSYRTVVFLTCMFTCCFYRTMKQWVWVRGVPPIVQLFTRDFEAWLMDVDLAPCSPPLPFGIYQPLDVSWLPSCPLSTSGIKSTTSQDTAAHFQLLWSSQTWWRLHSELSATGKSAATEGNHLRKQSASEAVWIHLSFARAAHLKSR